MPRLRRNTVLSIKSLEPVERSAAGVGDGYDQQFSWLTRVDDKVGESLQHAASNIACSVV